MSAKDESPVVAWDGEIPKIFWKNGTAILPLGSRVNQFGTTDGFTKSVSTVFVQEKTKVEWYVHHTNFHKVNSGIGWRDIPRRDTILLDSGEYAATILDEPVKMALQGRTIFGFIFKIADLIPYTDF